MVIHVLYVNITYQWLWSCIIVVVHPLGCKGAEARLCSWKLLVLFSWGCAGLVLVPLLSLSHRDGDIWSPAANSCNCEVRH